MPESVTPEKALREQEREITCNFCREHFVDPKSLSCGHTFCKRCILKLSNGGQSNFPCPECNTEVQVPEGGVDLLKDAPEHVQDALLNFSLNERVETLKKAKCGSCNLMNDAVDYCKKCCLLLCSACTAAHQRMKLFASHKRLRFEELEGEDVERLVSKCVVTQTCPEHATPQIAYCFECDQLACHGCLVAGHRKHRFVFNRSASPRARQELLSELERLDIIEDFISQVQNSQNFADAPEDVWMEIQDSIQELHAILEGRQEELVNEAVEIFNKKAEKLSEQQSSLSEAMKCIYELKTETEAFAAKASDEDDTESHADFISRIEEAAEAYDNPQDKHEHVEVSDISAKVDCAESLQMMCSDQISVVLLEVDPGKCSVEFDEDKPPKMNRKSNGRLVVRLSNNRGARSACEIECKIVCSADGASVPCSVELMGGGVYHICFTPTSNKYHELTASVNGEPLSGSPFSFFVYVPPASQGESSELLASMKKNLKS